MNIDVIKRPLRDIVNLIMTRVDYYALYECTVVAQSGNLVDVKPIPGSRAPGLQGVRIWTGNSGDAPQVPNGTHVLLGWRGGDPTLPFAGLWGQGGLTSSVLTASSSLAFVAPAVDLGSTSPTDQAVRGTSYLAAEAALFAQLNTEFAAAGAALTSAGGAANFTLAQPFLATAGGALTALAAAFTTFNGLAGTFKSSIVKLS